MAIDFWLLVFALIVTGAFTVSAATGFGSIIISLALGLYLYPMPLLLPILVALDVILCAYLVWRYHASIDPAMLYGRMLPWMTAGLLLGLSLSLAASERALQRLFGVFVLVLSVRELLSLRHGHTNRRALTPAARAVGLAGAGVIHGVFATGGPLLVYVLGRAQLEKGTFRSTLAAVWLILDLVLLATYAGSGRMGVATLLSVVALLPSLLAATVLGEWAHDRLDERRFRVGVFALLMVVGLSIAV
jgi:uncharacterized membrane protein YfcA